MKRPYHEKKENSNLIITHTTRELFRANCDHYKEVECALQTLERLLMSMTALVSHLCPILTSWRGDERMVRLTVDCILTV